MGTYCSAQEVRAMIKDDALNTLIGDKYIEDTEEKEKAFEPFLDQAIVDATAEIDGYLSKRYPLPLSPVPGVINKFAKDIAVYNLYSRIGVDESTREKNVLIRYQSAIKFLELLANGKVEIGENDPQSSAISGFQLTSAGRVFSRNKLGGM